MLSDLLKGDIHPTASDEFSTSPQRITSQFSFSQLCEIMTQKSHSIDNILVDGELEGNRTVKKFLIVRREVDCISPDK